MENIPILKLYDTLIVSIQTGLHDRIAIQLQTDILNKIDKTKAKLVIIDISALDIVDSFVGRMLADTASMATVFNAQVVLVGMQPAVTVTLVELGMELKNVKTAIDLESAFELFFSSKNNQIKEKLKMNDDKEMKLL